MKRAVVLLSGGLDSMVCAALAREQGFERLTLTPHAFERDWSLPALKAWCRRLGYAERGDVPSEFKKPVKPDAD